MDVNQAVYVLIQGCEIAQERGAYKLSEAKDIYNAIEYISKISKTDETENNENNENATENQNVGDV